MKTPYWANTSDDSWFKYDVIARDTNPPVVNGISHSLGIATSGENSGLQSQTYQPSGFHGLPVLATIGGAAATEAIGRFIDAGCMTVAFRDTINQFKAGDMTDGETCIYAPGCQNPSKVYLDINGNILVMAPTQIQLQVTNGQEVLVTKNNIALGSDQSNGYYVALDKKLNTIMNNLLDLANTLKTMPLIASPQGSCSDPGVGGWAMTIGDSATNLVTSINENTPVGSTVVKVQ